MRDDRERLRDIQEAIERIEKYTNSRGQVTPSLRGAVLTLIWKNTWKFY